MRYFVGGAFSLVGLFTAGAGGRMAMTGTNLPGWMRRVRKRDELRIQRAPGATYIAAILGFAGLFVVGLILSVVWLFVISSRYKLFRWDKP